MERKAFHKLIENRGLIGKLLAGRGAFFGGSRVGLHNLGNLADGEIDLIDGSGLPFHSLSHPVHLFRYLSGKGGDSGYGNGNFFHGFAAAAHSADGALN